MKCTHQGIRDVLAACAPLPSADIAEFFPGSSHRDVASMLGKMRGAARKVVYIHSWARGEPGGRDGRRPMYALGDKPDAPPPRKLSSAQVSAAYRRRRARPASAPASVFNLARCL